MIISLPLLFGLLSFASLIGFVGGVAGAILAAALIVKRGVV